MKKMNDKINEESIEQLLPKGVRENLIFEELTASFDYVLNKYVYEDLKKLRNLRATRDNQGTAKELEIIKQKAHDLNLPLEVIDNIDTTLTEIQQAKQLTETVEDNRKYNQIVTSYQIQNYLSNILGGIEINIYKLWAIGTTDPEYQQLTEERYVPDEEKITAYAPEEAPLGTYFPTSTYRLYYNASQLPDQSAEYQDKFEELLRSLFLKITPLSYCLEDIFPIVPAEIANILIGGKAYIKEYKV